MAESSTTTYAEDYQRAKTVLKELGAEALVVAEGQEYAGYSAHGLMPDGVSIVGTQLEVIDSVREARGRAVGIVTLANLHTGDTPLDGNGVTVREALRGRSGSMAIVATLTARRLEDPTELALVALSDVGPDAGYAITAKSPLSGHTFMR